MCKSKSLEGTKAGKERLKALFRGYRHVDSVIVSGLRELGFDVNIGKRHCKVTHNNDRSRVFVISATPSDGRAGINAAMLLASALQI